MCGELVELDVYNRNLRYVDEYARREAEVDEVLRQRREERRWPSLWYRFQAVAQSLIVRLVVPSR